MSDTAAARTERADFQATSDPRCSTRGQRQSSCSATAQLYELWERQQWATQDIDFTQDRIDWHERIPAEERFQRMYGLSLVLHRRAAGGRRARPDDARRADEEMRIFLCTQIADEARHVAFFNRFYDEVGVLEADNLQDRLEETSEHLNPEFDVLFDEMLHGAGRPPRARARGPRDAGRGDDALPHGHRGHARPHRPALHHQLQRASRGRCRGSSRASSNVARDEHRHVAFGARFLRDMAAGATRATATRSSARWSRSGPVADGVLDAAVVRRTATRATLFGVSLDETRAFAMKALERRLKVIGLVPRHDRSTSTSSSPSTCASAA